VTHAAEEQHNEGAPQSETGAGAPQVPQPGQILEGEILEADARRLVVSLPSGHRGIARSGAVERTSGEGNGPKVGEAVRVRVLGMTAEHQARVELLLPDAGPEGDPFDQEMHRLSDALRNQSTVVTVRNTKQSESIEGRIGSWIDRISAGLEKVQAHRSDRLSREFYDQEGKDGGSRAKRRSRH
jgi:hypothetical protein